MKDGVKMLDAINPHWGYYETQIGGYMRLRWGNYET